MIVSSKFDNGTCDLPLVMLTLLVFVLVGLERMIAKSINQLLFYYNMLANVQLLPNCLTRHLVIRNTIGNICTIINNKHRSSFSILMVS